jgi:EAL domain-containing protein (putative c-di-GMP-specific phosphodiesterase class I)
LIISDLNIPRLNGIDFIRKIRDLNRDVPIIITSTNYDAKVLQNSINYGVQGFISKPINVEKLQEQIYSIKKNRKPSSYHIINTTHPQEEFHNFLKPLKNSIVVLIKIEEFKYLNKFLTQKISKKLQNIFAKELLKHIPSRCNFSKIYLLENGEFVFAKEYNPKQEREEFYNEVKIFQKKVNEAKIKIGSVDYTLSILTSLSYGTNALENAKVGMSKLLENKQDFIIANELVEKEQEYALKKLETFRMIQEAIDSYNIVSYFQPIVNNKTKEIEKYESLVRLIDKNQNIISPYFFLDTAKESKYYQKITSIVLKNSFQALYNTKMNISINLSSLDIEQEETKKYFFYLLEKHKKEAHRIVIELLEDEKIKDKNIIKSFIKEAKKFNVKIAIDDFGAGLSNFSRVLEYQPDYIKIDGSLIRNIEEDKFSKDMVETIVHFSKKQNIKTIAEYVENENIFNILCDLGIDYSQGYYFGKAEVL